MTSISIERNVAISMDKSHFVETDYADSLDLRDEYMEFLPRSQSLTCTKIIAFAMPVSIFIVLVIFGCLELFWQLSEETATTKSSTLMHEHHQLKSSTNQTKNHLIPRTIFMTQKFDICDFAMPSYLQQDLASKDRNYLVNMLNVQRIKAFNPEFEIICFDDEKAYNYLMEKNESFAEYFKNEPVGKYKADILRVVYLYYEGGYYFDSDLEPMMPFSNILKQHLQVSLILVAQSYFRHIWDRLHSMKF